MLYNDTLYGEIEITEPVILELMKTKELQRLQGLNQSGLPYPYPRRQKFTRYDHSIGVYLLLQKLGTSIEEQIAGLIHDVSHTAFSHAIDWVYMKNGGNEEMQDDAHDEYVQKSSIPGILQDYGYDPRIAIDYDDFKILEQSAPNLCADRVDYSLRELDTELSSRLVNSMCIRNNEITFDNEQDVRDFAEGYMELQREHWGGFEGTSRFTILAEILKRALGEKYVTHEDFWTSDMEVMDILISKSDPKIDELVELLKSPTLDHVEVGEETAVKKFRYVDPLVDLDGEIKRLIEVDEGYRAFLEDQRRINALGIKTIKL